MTHTYKAVESDYRPTFKVGDVVTPRPDEASQWLTPGKHYEVLGVEDRWNIQSVYFIDDTGEPADFHWSVRFNFVEKSDGE